MEKRLISSASTRFWRYFFPIGAGVVFLGYLFSKDMGRVPYFNLAVLFTAVLFILSLWCATKLRIVATDEEHLFVSSSSGEIRVPYSDVKEIFVPYGVGNRFVLVKLKTRYSFGSTFLFLPASREAENIVDSLRARAVK